MRLSSWTRPRRDCSEHLMQPFLEWTIPRTTIPRHERTEYYRMYNITDLRCQTAGAIALVLGRWTFFFKNFNGPTSWISQKMFCRHLSPN